MDGRFKLTNKIAVKYLVNLGAQCKDRHLDMQWSAEDPRLPGRGEMPRKQRVRNAAKQLPLHLTTHLGAPTRRIRRLGKMWSRINELCKKVQKIPECSSKPFLWKQQHTNQTCRTWALHCSDTRTRNFCCMYFQICVALFSWPCTARLI